MLAMWPGMKPFHRMKPFHGPLCFGNLLYVKPVAAIWTFWIYPRAAKSDGATKIGLKQ